MPEFHHRTRTAGNDKPLSGDARPEPGPIALIGEFGAERIRETIESAGGTVAPLGADTRGLVLLHASAVDRMKQALAEHEGIRWVQLPMAGVDAFVESLAEYAQRGLVVTSAKGAYSEPVAEHALTLTLATLRELPEHIRAGGWGERRGLSLYGARVLIVGAGGIALEYLDLIRPFRPRVTVVRRRPEAVEGAERTITTDDIDEALPETDVVMLAAAANDGTRQLFDANRLGRLPSHAVLINIARGPLVDTEALADALEAGRLHGAGLDVTDPEPLPEGHRLYENNRAIITPHTADTDEMVEPLYAERVRENVDAFMNTGAFVGLVDVKAGY